jgi:hypothetical protein
VNERGRLKELPIDTTPSAVVSSNPEVTCPFVRKPLNVHDNRAIETTFKVIAIALSKAF